MHRLKSGKPDSRQALQVQGPNSPSEQQRRRAGDGEKERERKKTDHLDHNRHLIFSNIQKVYHLKMTIYKKYMENISETASVLRFINSKTTCVMDDFISLWKEKQSALWKNWITECSSSIREERVKNHVESHFKEARHPMSALFFATEKVSLGLGRSDLNFIRKERGWPPGSFLFKKS